MIDKSILHVPLLSPGWKVVGYAFLPLPIILALGLALSGAAIESSNPSQILFGFWAIGFGLLNLCRDKNEDEMIKSFRLQAYQTGFFWLIWGLAALMLISYFGTGGFTSNFLSVFSILFLLNAYIYAAFQYQKYMATKE
ncbi:hypothetical protein LV84_02981 [Algoriphagus ratkowskyi]|uniref:Uncharacterized protein n=1 Tax=Algoriphagus ratkowskyi TaxID=57028 RepID=A0A2W7QZ98_9BACT|nr:hypothetical protein [Algoriphagus ratkowskyi]PZX53873.1 hypothetical protein LV84_02981 [Algoriphagus ratkowskyi]TXD76722.1 hypothetical protein ESW18_15275 [Algoriphagus ratkowskyi]